VRNEKLKVWRSIKAVPVENAVRGQYGPGEVDGKYVIGYRREERVRIEIDNWRWAGVPFYLRAGKRLARRLTEVSIVFKQPPTDLFQTSSNGQGLESNVLTIRIQPDEGITHTFGTKVPGPTTNVSQVDMHFSYADAFGKTQLTDTSAFCLIRCLEMQHCLHIETV
jgi:glucose-6-phosphate 1-dehydrogenase